MYLPNWYEDGLPIIVTIIYWHFYYCGPLYCPILYDKGSLFEYIKMSFLLYSTLLVNNISMGWEEGQGFSLILME